ncbi:MAG: type II toxin-antitoxin system PemK/MazF family toxin [Clostridiales bacterium]|nr:type II toxin-antitoxin system PemK/MazF family toxin [Clostridiales bacterium]
MKVGDVYFADLRPVVGSEPGGIRPVVIIRINKLDNGETVLCAPLSKDIEETEISVRLNECTTELISESCVILEQMRNIDKRRLKEKIATLSDNCMEHIRKSMLSIFCV